VIRNDEVMDSTFKQQDNTLTATDNLNHLNLFVPHNTNFSPDPNSGVNTVPSGAVVTHLPSPVPNYLPNPNELDINTIDLRTPASSITHTHYTYIEKMRSFAPDVARVYIPEPVNPSVPYLHRIIGDGQILVSQRDEPNTPIATLFDRREASGRIGNIVSLPIYEDVTIKHLYVPKIKFIIVSRAVMVDETVVVERNLVHRVLNLLSKDDKQTYSSIYSNVSRNFYNNVTDLFVMDNSIRVAKIMHEQKKNVIRNGHNTLLNNKTSLKIKRFIWSKTRIACRSLDLAKWTLGN
jgi:hypothetical protein